MPPASMPAVEARDLLARLGWSQAVAADRLGVSPRMMRHYLALEPAALRQRRDSAGAMPPTVAELLRRVAEDQIGKTD